MTGKEEKKALAEVLKTCTVMYEEYEKEYSRKTEALHMRLEKVSELVRQEKENAKVNGRETDVVLTSYKNEITVLNDLLCDAYSEYVRKRSRIDEILSCLGMLEAKEQKVLRMYYLDQYGIRDIAEELGVAEITVKVLKSKALGNMYKLCGDLLKEEPEDRKV